MTTTIAERHDLQRGDLCEIWIEGIMGRSKRFGQYLFTGSDGKLFFNRGQAPMFALAPERIRSVQKVTEQYVAKQFYPGQLVNVHKYGGTYRARIESIGHKRLNLTFTTLGGKDKKISVAAWQVT